ncbi:MAG: heme-binding protein [Methylophilaceae bacterium]
MNKILYLAIWGVVTGATMMASTVATADNDGRDGRDGNAGCRLVTRAQFEAAANSAATETDGFGFGLPMWASMVDVSGKVCHVYSTDSGAANTGAAAGNKAWLGSRLISAQKANTANAFSLDNLTISTGALYVAVLPGGSLYGLQHSNPVDASVAYGGSPVTVGTNADFLKNKRIGGVNVFGGGVALYSGGVKVGAIGASGDTSCRDHTFAWRMRVALGLDGTPNSDALALVATPTALFQQPLCGVNDPLAANGGGATFGISN